MDRATEDQLLSLLANSRLHRSFSLPPNPPKGRNKPLRVTYADVGRLACEDEVEEARKPTVWFCGGLMAGRWLAAAADSVAAARGVRLIMIDRPGMGGTDKVPLDERLDVYMEIVPALLAHLRIRHITLAGNSGGVIYAFNILLQHRHLLHPRHPTVAIFAPWVHQSHSDSTAMALTAYVPRAGVANLHNVISFVNKRVAPMFGFSSGMVAKIIPSDDKPALDTEPAEDEGEGEDRVPLTPEERKMEKYRFPMILKYALAEEMSGASEDGLLLLKRTGKPDPWGAWGDFDTYVPLLAKQEANRQRANGEKLLKVEAFYAENDHMTGKKGWKWFDSCWNEEARGGVIDFESCTWPKSTHDEILDRKLGLLDKWVKDVAKMYEED